MTAKKFRVPDRGPRRRRANGVRLSRQISGLDIDKRGFAVPPRVEGGKPRWQWLMRTEQPNGERRCEYIYAATFTEAEIIADRVAEELRIGGAVEVAKALKGWTVAETFERWLASRDDSDGALTVAGRDGYQSQFDAEIAKPLGNTLVAELTDERIRAWKKGLLHRRLPNGKKQQRMKRTMQRYARLLRTILRFAREQGQLTAIPGDGMLKVKVSRVTDGGDMREHYPMSDDELARLLAEIRRIASPSVAMACTVAAVIGMRDQELTHLRLENLLLDADVPHVWIRRHTCDCPECVRHKSGTWTPKTKRERRIPLPELVTELRTYLAARAAQLVGRESQHVFPMWERTKRKRAGGMVDRSTYNDAVQQAVTNLGMEIDRTRQLLTFHTFRSVAATNLDSRANGNQTAVAVALGHQLPGQQDRYNRLRERLPELYAALYPDANAELKVVRGSVKQKIA